MKLMELIKFTVDGRTFEIYGNYSIEENEDMNSKEYHYPEFSDLTAYEIKDGKPEAFEPDGYSWGGRKYDVSDMIGCALAAMIMHSSEYSVEYLLDGLKSLVSEYTGDVVLTADGIEIPRRVLSADMWTVYELTLVTNEYIYYVSYDTFLMLDAKTHKIVSDNFFAESGYNDSCENIKTGKETLVWGTPYGEED